MVAAGPSRDRPDTLAAKVAAAIDRIARAQRVRRQAAATEHGLTPLQIDLLSVLADGVPPEPLVGLLAREVGVSQPTATESLRALAAKGLIERRRDPEDGRRTTVALTPAGRRATGQVTRTDERLVAAIAALPTEVQAATLAALLSVIARLVEDGTIDVARTCTTCRFHRLVGSTHHCGLLEVDLAPGELRVNCPEHEPA